MNYSCVVVAAGQSSRFEAKVNKMLYVLPDGLTVLEKSLQLFREDEDCRQLIVVCSEETRDYLLGKPRTEKEICVLGGANRSDSVYAGLSQVSQAMVMVHDGARCYLTQPDLESLKKTMQNERAAILVRKEIDTIKQVRDGYIVCSVDREQLNRAQTPQAFETELLKKAYQQAMQQGDVLTDEASAVEKYSTVPIRCVLSQGPNEKVTTLNDIR